MPETPESEPSEGARVVAKGARVTLANGAEAEIVLSVPVIVAIEDRYGSIEGFTEAWGSHIKGKIFGHLIFLFSQCFEVSEDEAMGLVDSRRLAEYMEAVVYAIQEALPGQRASEAVAPNGKAVPGKFRGAATSGSRSRSGTSPRSSSGG